MERIELLLVAIMIGVTGLVYMIRQMSLFSPTPPGRAMLFGLACMLISAMCWIMAVG